jgi:hypothetical protein
MDTGSITKIIALLAIAAAGLTVLNSLLKKSSGTPKNFPYRKKEYLLSSNENNIYQLLLDVVGGNLYVFPKVSLSEIVLAKSNVKNLSDHTRRLKSFCVDFVLCSNNKNSPVLVINLEKRTSPKDKDNSDLYEILNSAGIPYINLRSNTTYDSTEITSLIRDSIGHVGEIRV